MRLGDRLRAVRPRATEAFNYIAAAKNATKLTNIDLLYLLTPIVTMAFSFGLVVYWHYRRSFTMWVLLYSLGAYAVAIALKYIVQIPTIGAFSSNQAALGLYYGMQTAAFEVGGAYVFATMAVSRRKFTSREATGYGLGLAFWENGVLLSIPLLIDYITYYVILATPSSGLAQTILPILTRDSPGLFYGPSSALPLVFYAVLERLSSLMAHFAWGFLCVMAAVHKKKLYFAVAFPMGFIDFLVPFAGSLGTGFFELVVFLVSAACVVVALRITSGVRRVQAAPGSPPSVSTP